MRLVDEEVDLGALTLRIRRPTNPGDLIDEARFADDEYMPYWSELWPAGVALAREVAARPDLRGKRVLELGAGLGLPSIAAALGGAAVLATDWADDAMPLLHENAERNGAQVETLVADWRDPAAFAERGPWDLVIAADVLYEERNVEPLSALLERLAAPLALVADPGRTYLEPFREALGGLRVNEAHPDPELPRLTLLTLRP